MGFGIAMLIAMVPFAIVVGLEIRDEIARNKNPPHEKKKGA